MPAKGSSQITPFNNTSRPSSSTPELPNLILIKFIPLLRDFLAPLCTVAGDSRTTASRAHLELGLASKHCRHTLQLSRPSVVLSCLHCTRQAAATSRVWNRRIPTIVSLSNPLLSSHLSIPPLFCRRNSESDFPTPRHAKLTMFSPSQQGAPASNTRSRRRQRNPIGDTTLTQQPKPKRPRGPLTESALTNPDVQNAQPEMAEVKNSGKVAKLPKSDEENAPPTQRALRSQVVVRSKKPKQGERTSKSDGSIELVSLPETALFAKDSLVINVFNPLTSSSPIDKDQRIHREQAASTAG